MIINPFPHVLIAYQEIQKMKSELPNDQELGRAVRKYLNDIKEGKIFKNGTLEFDEPNKEKNEQ